MSKTMNIKLEIHDREALKRACDRLGYRMLGENTYNLYQTAEHGVGVQIPGMKYPVVVKDDGTIAMDDYDWNGVSGKVGARFDHSIIAPLEATYGLEKSIGEAVMKGYLTQETEDETEFTLKITLSD